LPVDPAVVALVRTVADLLTRWADAHTAPPEPASAATETVAITSTDGNTLIACISMRGGSAQTVASITDDADNTWVLDGTGVNGNTNSRAAIWRTNQDGGPVTSVTITFTAAIVAACNISEWPGTLTLDVPATVAGNSASLHPPATTVTVTSAADLVIGAINGPFTSGTATATPDAPFAALTRSIAQGASTWALSTPAWQPVTAAGTYGPRWTLSQSIVTGSATAAYVVPAATTAASWIRGWRLVVHRHGDGLEQPEGTAAGTWTVTGTAVGRRAPRGSGAGTHTWTGSASGTRPAIGGGLLTSHTPGTALLLPGTGGATYPSNSVFPSPTTFPDTPTAPVNQSARRRSPPRRRARRPWPSEAGHRIRQRELRARRAPTDLRGRPWLTSPSRASTDCPASRRP
jgi:hypothetical protein